MTSARDAAVKLLLKIEKDDAYSTLSVAEASGAADFADAREQALFAALVYGVLERKLTIDYYLDQLVDQGIDTTVMVGPIMSSLRGKERELADAIIDTGVKRASLDRLNPRPLLSERLDRMGIGASPDSVELMKRYLSDAGIFVEDAF